MTNEILLIANLVVSLFLVIGLGYVWNIMVSLSSISVYTALYLKDKFEDFGENQYDH